jgi:hypothetical protein
VGQIHIAKIRRSEVVEGAVEVGERAVKVGEHSVNIEGATEVEG